jgi:hypothetical protein
MDAGSPITSKATKATELPVVVLVNFVNACAGIAPATKQAAKAASFVICMSSLPK